MVSDHLHSISQMVRTRATTAPTPTPARQDASEPATEVVARRGAAARGRCRGRGRTSFRGKGQVPGPANTRAMTPPPTEEVVREGEEGENEQVQNEELPPQHTQRLLIRFLLTLAGYLIKARHLPCFLHQHHRFREYNIQLLWLPAWMPHWK